MLAIKPYPELTSLGRERHFRTAFGVIASLVFTGLIGHLLVLLWARHEFTQVESVVALHASMLINGDGLYYDLNRYPFTVSPYGPLFYGASALLHKLGAPLLLGGRMISFLALLGIGYLVWRALGLLVSDRYARIAGVALTLSTANLVSWGTVAQVDMLACFFSLSGFVSFLEWRKRRNVSLLCLSGLFLILAVFTKQTFVAAGAAIGICLLIEGRKRALFWLAGVAAVGIMLAIALNSATGGHFVDNAIRANLNPFSVEKLQQQLEHLLLTSSGLILIGILGVRYWSRRLTPLYLYTGLAAGVFLATAAKVGSDLNYQIELTLLLVLCAACALDRLSFFPKCFAADRGSIALLQIPLLVHIALNLALGVTTVLARAMQEPPKRVELEQLQPYLNRSHGRVLSVQLDALAHFRGRMEVEPLIYTLLVDAGMTDPSAVRRDLAARQFKTVILYENVFADVPSWKSAETPSLPNAHLNEIRRYYRLVKHVPGPYLEGNYIYEPVAN